MLKRPGSVLAALALLSIGHAAPAHFTGRVVGVQDGDTLTVLVGTQQVRVRLVEIDAPELRQPFGRRSKASLARMCAGLEARVHDEGQDRYKRTLGHVMCGQLDANAEQVRSGMAWVFVRYAPKSSALYSLEASARAQRVGLWSDPHPVAPWEWRALKRR